MRRKYTWSRYRHWLVYVGVFAGLCGLAALVYRLPPVYERLSWRVENFRTRMVYAFNPPDEAVFIPSGQMDLEAVVQATLSAMTQEAGVFADQTPSGPTPTVGPSPTPTITTTPLPASAFLEVKYEHQHGRWNYCGPANLTMALTYWGWGGTRDIIGKALKPGTGDGSKGDKNVMPYEMEDYVESQTDLKMIVRHGGEIEVIKNLIAGGFPVIAEKGYYEIDYTGNLAWMGHYQVINGYDDSRGIFIVQDTYLEPGENLEIPYADFNGQWRYFNYQFMLVYPPEREAEVLQRLGVWADQDAAYLHGMERATDDILMLSEIDLFFAWFNKGTNHVGLRQYIDAAFAYDHAFSLYAQLNADDTQRPYRMMWYQTGPYWAYYYSGRYQDVINLANTTLNDTIAEPTLEESIYWRGRAREALGDREGAIADYREALRLNYNFTAARSELERLGVPTS